MKETTYKLNTPVSIALLGDFHNGDPAPIIASLRSHTPDLIAIAGDVMYGRRPENDVSPLETQEKVLPFLKGCAKIATTFMSLGNHEWPLDKSDLELISSTGVVVLDNTWEKMEIDGACVLIGGLTSEYVTAYRRSKAEIITNERYPKVERDDDRRPDLSWLPSFAATKPESFHILLNHHPEYIPLIPQNIDLVLSAHAHGGQWRIFGHGVFAPGQGFWPRWTHGVYGRMVVTAGLSNTTRIPRLFNPCEVVYIDPLAL